MNAYPHTIGFLPPEADNPGVQAMIDRYAVDNECRHGRLPHEGCSQCLSELRPPTPDLMKVLPRVPARRVLRSYRDDDRAAA